MSDGKSLNLLELDGIKVKLSGLQILDGVTIRVPHGLVTGLIGPNGAGKTTVFNVISGFVKQDEGTVTYDGRRQKHMKAHKLTKMGISRTLQGVGLFGSLTALENVMQGGSSRIRSGILSESFAMPWTDIEQSEAAGRRDGRPRPARHRRSGRPPARASCRTPSRSGWRWPGPCCRTRSCSSSTSRPVA